MSARARPAAAAAPPLLAAGLLLVAMATAVAALRLATLRPEATPVLAAAAGAGAVLVLRPAWILPAFVALTWSAVDASLLGGLPSPVQWGGLVLAAAGAVRVARRPEVAAPALAIAGLLAAPLVLSWLVAADRAGLTVVDGLRDLLFLLIGAWCARGPADVERVLTALCGVGLVLGAGAALSVAVGPSALFPVVAEGPGQVRAAGPFGEPNFFALSLAAIVPAALVLVGRTPARTLLGVAALAAIAAGILATGSRGAAIAAIVGLLATAATGDRRSRRAGLALLLCAAAATPLFSAQLGGAEGRTTSGRQTENLIALAMAADHPLLGVGPGGYPGLYRDYGRRLGSDPRSDREPHSLPLQIAAEQGVVGVACWGVALVLLVGALRRARGIPAARTVGLCLGTYAVGSLFLHGSQLRLPYLLAGLALTLAASARTAAASAPRPAAAGDPVAGAPTAPTARPATEATA